MIGKMKISRILLLVFFCFTISKAQNHYGNKNKLNFHSSLYSKITQQALGELNLEEYSEFRLSLENQIKTKLPKNKAIIISYHQVAHHCFHTKQKSKIQFQKNILKLKELAETENALVFFYYNPKSKLGTILKNTIDYKKDTDYFFQQLFSNQDFCTAIFVVKPNREFIKYYGLKSEVEISYFLDQK